MRILFGCAVLLLAVPAVAQAPIDVKKAETSVKAYILDNADDPDSVKFVKWGPHATRTEKQDLAWGPVKDNFSHLNTTLEKSLERATDLAADKALWPVLVIRVRYRLRNNFGGLELHDTLFVAKGAAIIPIGDTQGGDTWAAVMDKKKARETP